jgi:hypothetical protein
LERSRDWTEENGRLEGDRERDVEGSRASRAGGKGGGGGGVKLPDDAVEDDSLGRGDWLVDREREGWEAMSTRVEMVDVEL